MSGSIGWGTFVAALALQCLVAGTATAAGDSASDRYVALVVGVGNYQGNLALTQPAADAAAVTTSLRVRGFQMISSGANGCGESGPMIDPSASTFQAAISCFAKAAAGARQVVFYFSGHSISREGKNFMAPATLSADDLSRPDQLVELQSVLDALEQARAELSLVVLDAARPAAKDVPNTTEGLVGIPPTSGIMRIIAYSAPVGRWADGGRPAIPRPTPETRGSPAPEESTLSPYTQRLVQAIDDDSELRSLDQPGVNLDVLLKKAASLQSASPAEISNENAGGAEMLGRMAKVGRSTCEVLNWRAENFGHCVEIGAAYENCGKDTAMRRKLQEKCSADWKTLVRYSLRASMVSAMKVKNCAALKDLVTKFEQEPGGKELDEYKEINSLAQYTCSVENKDKPSQPLPPPVATAKAGTTPDTGGRTAPTSTNFVISDNRDIYGQDIAMADGTIGFSASDIAACISDCQSKPMCVAVSFDRWKGKCYPKNKITTALMDASSSIAVKKPQPLPPVSTAKTDFQILRNARFGSPSFSKKRVVEFGACRTACEGESRCIAFGFLKSAAKSAPNCEMFELTSASIKDAAVDSAYKVQSP